MDAIGYPAFFLYTAALSIPGLVLLVWLLRTGVLNGRPVVAAGKGRVDSDD